ncbi:MAG: M48 family metallopeptidase [Candidatus Zixiibacteriota bacterium]
MIGDKNSSQRIGSLPHADATNRRRYAPTAPLLALVVAGALLTSSCVTTGPGGEKSFILISDAEEAQIGHDVDSTVRAENTLLPDTAWQNYLTRVGERIVKVCDRPNLEWEFHVIESDQINAFAIPGGHVYFYTGILRMMDDEAELAAVMAHEVSHVVGRHSVKSLQAALGGVLALQIALGDRSEGAAGKLAGMALGIALTGYGRGHELEADRYGVYYMQKAGYNPSGARSMFTKLAELGGGQSHGFFEKLASTHPETQERIAKIDAQIAAMPRSVDTLPTYKERYQTLKKRLPPPAPDSTKTR